MKNNIYGESEYFEDIDRVATDPNLLKGNIYRSKIPTPSPNSSYPDWEPYRRRFEIDYGYYCEGCFYPRNAKVIPTDVVEVAVFANYKNGELLSYEAQDDNDTIYTDIKYNE